jgi:phage terminase large subunit-like protein
MVQASPALERRVGILINNLHVAASNARFMPLSSDASTMDGLNVHGAIIDELHAHKTRHAFRRLHLNEWTDNCIQQSHD